MASKKNTSPIAILIFRLLTFILLLISLFVLDTDHKTVQFPFPNTNLRFKNYYADRYVLSVAALGCLCMLLQVPFAAINVGSGTIAGGNEHMMLYLIFADMVFSLLLMSGVGAGIGVTVEAKAYGFRLLFGDDYSAELDKEQSGYE